MDDLQRTQRDLEDLMLRVRNMENLDTPIFRQLIADLRATQSKLTDIDIKGTHVTRSAIADIKDDVKEIKTIIQRQEDNKLADRRVVLGALIAAAFAIAIAVVNLVAG